LLNCIYGFSVLLLLTSCVNQTVSSEIPTQRSITQLVDGTVKTIESDGLFLQFRANLEERNVELTSPDISSVAWLNAAPGVAYRVGDYWMNVHLYSVAAAAQENADRIPAGADSGMSDWVAPPHFFLCDRIIALYLGQDQNVIAALTEVCGPQFAGFQQQANNQLQTDSGYYAAIVLLAMLKQ